MSHAGVGFAASEVKSVVVVLSRAEQNVPDCLLLEWGQPLGDLMEVAIVQVD